MRGSTIRRSRCPGNSASARGRRIGEPFEIKAGRNDVRALFVEAKDSTVGQYGEVGIRAGAGFERLVHGPRFAVVAAEFYREVLAFASTGGDLVAGGIAPERVRR